MHVMGFLYVFVWLILYIHSSTSLMVSQFYNADGYQYYKARMELEAEKPLSPGRMHPHMELGNIYADPESYFYNPQKAEFHYFRSHAITFRIQSSSKFCTTSFLSFDKNPIQKEILDKFKTYCDTPLDELYEIAQSFEDGDGDFMADKYIAYALYSGAYWRAIFTPDNKDIKLKLREKKRYSKMSYLILDDPYSK